MRNTIGIPEEGVSMRGWFTVGAKLLGIYFLYWALTAISYLLPLLSAGSWTSTEPLRRSAALDSVLTPCVRIAFALLLLLKTDWVADRVGLEEDVSRTTGSSPRYSLQTGLVLVGTYIFVSHIGQLIKVLLLLRRENAVYGPIAASQPQGLSWSKDMIVPCITIVLSLFLIFGAKQLAKWLDKRLTEENDP